MGTTKRQVDLDQGLIDAAIEGMHDLGVRDNLSAIVFAVQAYLPVVVGGLKGAGLSAFPTGAKKNRAIPDETWEALTLAAEEEVPVDRISLLRACLTLAARGGRRPGNAATADKAG